MRSASAALVAASLGLALPSAARAPDTSLGLALPSAARAPDRWSGVRAEPDGMLVLAVLSPERAMVADPRTGATTARELPGGTLCHGPLLVSGGHVVYAGSRGGRAVALAAPLDRLDADRPLGAGYTIAASAAGRIWLGRTIGRQPTAMRLSLREVGVDGRVVRGSRRLVPRWGAVEGIVGGGLLITRGRGLVLQRPGGSRLLFRGGWPLAVAGDRFAWRKRGTRRVRVWIDGDERGFDPPGRLRPDVTGEAVFSPDGRRLALAVAARGRSRVAVLDLERGEWRIVPDGRLAGYKAIAWSPSGRWLYFTRGERVLAARGGTGRPVRLPIRTGGTVMSISTPGSAGR